MSEINEKDDKFFTKTQLIAERALFISSYLETSKTSWAEASKILELILVWVIGNNPNPRDCYDGFLSYMMKNKENFLEDIEKAKEAAKEENENTHI